jgi:K+-sensing histidine kinase KdpD
MTNNGKRLLFRQSKDVSLTVIGGLFESDDVEIRVVDALSEIIPSAREWTPDAIVVCENGDKPEVLSLCGGIRANPAVCGIPLVIIGDKTDADFKLNALKKGADECLDLYGDSAEIVLKLGNILKSQRYRRLLAEHNLFAMTCEHVEHGILLIDRDQHVIQANQTAQTEFGMSAGDGSTWIEQLSTRYTLGSSDEWAGVANNTQPTVLTMLEGTDQSVGNSDGRRWFRCVCYPLVDDPEKRVLVTIIDVTKQLEMQDILLGVKRLISHKMLTPLNGIIGPLEIVIEDEADGKDRVKLLKTALESADELASVVTRLEEYFLSPFTRDDEGFTEVGELRAIILRASSDLLVASLDCDIKAPARTYIPLGGHKISTVFVELFENAVKFHPKHRPAIHVKAHVKNDKLRIDVIDDGCHIPQGAMKYVHLPFYQAGTGLIGEISGQGIGLAQVSRIVMAVGGTVKFSNRTSCDGVCVSIFLPVSSHADSKKMSNADILADS